MKFRYSRFSHELSQTASQIPNATKRRCQMTRLQIASTAQKTESRMKASRLYRTTILSFLFFTLWGFSPVWGGDTAYMTPHPVPVGFSIHVGPGGVHLGFGGHRYRGWRPYYGYPRQHFGHRHSFKRPRPFHRHYYRHQHYGKHHKHRGYARGWRHHRRHRH